MSFIRFNIAPLVLGAACILAASSAGAATVAYYKWENGVAGARAHGQGVIADSSGNGIDGWASGGLKYEAARNPDSTLAMHFDGKSGRVWVPDNPLLELTHSLTLEAYVYVPDHSGGGAIVTRSDDRYDWDPYYLAVTSRGILVFLVEQEPSQGPSSYILSPHALALNRWIHVAGTLDDATGVQALYVNGALVASTTTTVRPFGKLLDHHHAGLGIGAGIKGSPDDGHTRASIDDLRISDVALDPSQFLPPP